MSRRFSISNSRGFTLVEVVTYIALFLFITVGSLSMVLSGQKLLAQYQVKQQLFVTSTTVMEQLLVEVRQAEAVIEAESVFATSTSQLSLQTASGTKAFSLVDGRLQLQEADGSVLELHSDTVTTTGFTVQYHVGGGSDLVRIGLEFSATGVDYTEQYQLQSGAVIRGTYAYEE